MTTRLPGKPYNGLRQPPNFQIPFGGQVHNLAAQRTPTPEEMKAAVQEWLDEQMQGLAKTIFVQSAAKVIDQGAQVADQLEEFLRIGKAAHVAAQAFFESKGFRFESPADAQDVGPEPQPPDGQ